MFDHKVKNVAKKKVKKAIYPLVLKLFFPFLLIGGLIFGIVFGFIILFGDTDGGGGFGGGMSGSGKRLSDEVLGYRPLVEEYAFEYGVEEHVDIILALMMQESGGKGDDPMQSSQSLCGEVDCITDPTESIQQGVKYFSEVLSRSESDIKLTLQSYNFGGGFIDFVMDNGGSYTQDLAIEFSQLKYDEFKHTGKYGCIRPEAVPLQACYGDIYYVDAVLSYYDFSLVVDGDFILPITGAIVSSEFGMRLHPIQGIRKQHTGIDLVCIGHVTPIYATGQGIVQYAGFHVNNDGTAGYGNVVKLDHGSGLITAYAHLSSIDVSEGDHISQGQKLGVCGSTGSSTAAHLHFETKTDLWDGHFDPRDLFDFNVGRLVTQ